MGMETGPSHDLGQEIRRLKKERNAVILAHFYQESEIQDLADFVEDSLGLARRAQKTDADVIAFAGVDFMAETAKILNPTKKVVIPDLEAGCSLEESCPPEAFAAFKAKHPGHLVISYINCSARVKALSDIICTSSNAEKIVARIPKDQPILFAPDRNLGAYLAKKLNRSMVLWNGSCMVHEIFSEKKMIQLKVKNPRALVIAHPECEEQVLRHADFIGSTSRLLDYVRRSPAEEFIIATEAGILHQMEKLAPGKKLIPAPPDGNCACNECPHMKKNTMEKLSLCLRDLKPEITMPESLRLAALRPLQRMFEMTDG
ncbi:MAG: quinolinate synthase NadA [Deltaproteobacteria bacterium]|nr:quinolinate synthase NadA [Deltaproteobacteria bacterium]MBI4373762.1 quinolinate synthase NadA [Deltaproteobacteria bacterium]